MDDSKNDKINVNRSINGMNQCRYKKLNKKIIEIIWFHIHLHFTYQYSQTHLQCLDLIFFFYTNL